MGNEGLEPSCFLFFCGSDHMTLAVACWEEDVTRDIFHINPSPLEVSSDGTLTSIHTHTLPVTVSSGETSWEKEGQSDLLSDRPEANKPQKPAY